MFYNLFDSHMHSHNSPDGNDSVMFMAQAALDQGLSGIAITDHCDYDHYLKKQYDKRIPHSVEDILEAREVYRGKVDIALGIELAQPHGQWDQVRELLGQNPYDIVLASVHRMGEATDLFSIGYAEKSSRELEELMNSYFDDMVEFVRRGDYDVLAHLTFIMRCAMNNNRVYIELKQYADRVEEVLILLRDKGKGLEINTSGLRGSLNDTMPPAWVLRRFRELGGEIVTIGSDAHRAGDVGKGIHHAMQMALDAGFDYFAFYRHRKPVMLRLI